MMKVVFKSLIVTVFAALAAFVASAQDGMDIKNHVIIAVDNAGCSWAGSDAVKDEVIRTLYNFRHDSVTDSLLKHDDYFSIVTFQARIDYPDNLLISRYATSENDCRYLSMPPSDLRKFFNSEWKSKSYHNFGTAYSLVSIAKAYALSAVNTNKYKTNRTFLVMVTDHHYNGNDFYDEVNNFARDGYRTRELRLTFDKPAFFQKSYDVNQEYYIRYLDTKEITGSYEGNHYKGYIEIYEYLPLQQYLSLSSVVDFPLTIKAERRPGQKYEAKVDFIRRPGNSHYNIEKLEVSADNGHSYAVFSHRDTVHFDHMISRSIKPDSLKVRAWLDLNDGVYNATVLTPSPDAPDYLGKNGLSVQIPIEYEKDAKVLGILPLSDSFWPSFIESQTLTAWLWSIILLGLLAALVLLDYKRRNNYSPALGEYEYNVNENNSDMKYNITETNGTGFAVTLGRQGQPLQQIHTATLDLRKREFYKVKPLSPNEKVRLSIEMKESNELILDDKNPAFVIQREGEQNTTASFLMKENREFITLLFNPDGIVDSTRKESPEKDNNLFTIKYDLILEILASDGSVKESKPLLSNETFQFVINEMPIIKPKFEIIPTSNLKEKYEKEDPKGILKIQYSETDPKPQFGELKVCPDLNMERCSNYDIDLELTTYVNGRQILEGVLFGDKSTPKSSKYSGTNLGVNPFGVPVYINMEKFPNPLNIFDTITLKIASRCSKHIEDVHVEQNAHYVDNLDIMLYKNTGMVRLVETFTKDIYSPAPIRTKTGDERASLPLFELSTYGDSSFSFDFFNSAEVGNGKVSIKELELSLDSKNLIINGAENSINDIFDLTDEGNLRDKSSTHDLGIGKKESKSIVFKYNAKKINSILNGDISEDEAEVDIVCSYKYHDEACEEGKFNEHTTILPIRIIRVPQNQKWLCVDFGTSAISALYGAGTDDRGVDIIQDDILNLSTNKQKHFNGISDFNDKLDIAKIDTSEKDSEMISSVITINDEEYKSSTDSFANSQFWFSPHGSLIGTRHYPLPCLKSLMGHSILPGEFVPQNIATSITGNESIPLVLPIDSIFKTAYHQFFQCYLDDPCGKKPTLTNQVIFTVPNTYSPKDICSLKEIIRDKLKYSFPRFTKFISESDAVAFFYVQNRRTFERNSGTLDDGYDSKVLVYDMGAGTLDLTYFEYDSKNKILDIKGKMGVNKAGNYFDYAIAESVVGLVKTNGDPGLLQNKKDLKILLDLKAEDPDCTKAILLKSYIKDKVKPALDDDDINRLLSNPDKEIINDTLFSSITLREVLDSEPVKEYLDYVSNYVLTNFNQLFGGDVKPTMVLFSGRSCALRLIRERVLKALKNNNMTDDTVYIADISNMKITQNVILKTDPEGVNRLKTVVIEGALASANMGTGFKIKEKPIYASYGLILKKAERDYKWVPLVSSDSTLEQEQPQEYLYNNTTELNLSNYSDVYLIQTFSADTVNDWENGKKELITVIDHFQPRLIHGSREEIDTIKLVITTDKQLHFAINGSWKELSPFDDYRDESFKKSAWPSIQRTPKQ